MDSHLARHFSLSFFVRCLSAWIRTPKNIIIYLSYIPLAAGIHLQAQETAEISFSLKRNQYLSIVNAASSSPNEKQEALDSLAAFCLQEGDTLQSYRYELEKVVLLSTYGNSFDTYYTSKKILQDLSLRPPSAEKDSLMRRTLLLAATTAQKSSYWEESLGLCSDFIQQYPDMLPIEAAQIYSTIGSDNMFIGNISISKRLILRLTVIPIVSISFMRSLIGSFSCEEIWINTSSTQFFFI